MAIKQGYRGGVSIGNNLRMPALPGSTCSMPKNYQYLPVVHNHAWEYLYVEGLQFPVLRLVTLVNSNWFSAANLNAWLLTRTNDDLSAISGPSGATDYGATFFDGGGGWKIATPKLASFAIGSSQGSPVNCEMTLVGTELLADNTPSSAYTVITEQPSNWTRVSFSGIDEPVSWQLMWSTGMAPDPAHNPGSPHPAEQNAGRASGGLTLTMKAEDTMPPDASAIAITVGVGSPNVDVTFTVVNPHNQAPNERALQGGRVLRQWQLKMLGSVSGTAEACPLTIA